MIQALALPQRLNGKPSASSCQTPRAHPPLPGIVSLLIHSHTQLDPRPPVWTPQATWGPTLVMTAGTARGLLPFPFATPKPVNPTQTLFLPTFSFLVNSSEPDKQETGLLSILTPQPSHTTVLSNPVGATCEPSPNPGTAHLTAAVYLACTEASLLFPRLPLTPPPPSTSTGFTQ